MKRLVVLYQQHDHKKKKKNNIEVGMEVIIESNENLVGNLALNIRSLHNCPIYNIKSLWTFKKKDASAS
jgi:hypothetical protein